MDWVMIIIAFSGPVDGKSISVATAQFETKALCQSAAKQIRENVRQNDGSKPMVGMCFPATEAAN
ncbi:MAG: hypothetical protein GY789_20650 [Hyphomicrobiales bacterium]|nr:hypothetical protein [Hyphomicrobiales bacterium]